MIGIEIHAMGAVKPKSGYLTRYVNGIKSVLREPIPKLCLYENRNTAGKLGTGRLGIERKVAFSQTFITKKPNTNDIITIDKDDYKIDLVINRNYNVGFLPFWECELKSIKPNTK